MNASTNGAVGPDTNVDIDRGVYICTYVDIDLDKARNLELEIHIYNGIDMMFCQGGPGWAVGLWASLGSVLRIGPFQKYGTT